LGAAGTGGNKTAGAGCNIGRANVIGRDEEGDGFVGFIGLLPFPGIRRLSADHGAVLRLASLSRECSKGPETRREKDKILTILGRIPLFSLPTQQQAG
jgi:hypothetical protein